MKRIQFLMACGIFFLLAVTTPGFGSEYAPSGFPPGEHWKQIESDHFIIVFNEQHRHIAQEVLKIADNIHHDISTFLQYEPSSKTYVVMTDHLDEYNAYANPMPNNTIVLYLNEPGAGGANFGLRSEEWLPMVLTHEYTHIVHLDMASKWYGGLRKIFGRTIFPNAGLPTWMIEGLAVYTETKFRNGRGHHPNYDMMMRTDVLEDEFKPLDQMSIRGLRKWPMGHIVYLYGYFFMRYLAETYGEDSLVKFNLENSRKFPVFGGNMFKKVFGGKKVSTLWREWRDSFQEHYQQQIQEIQTEPLTTTRPLSASGYFTNSPVFSPDGEDVYYIDYGQHEPPALVRLHVADQTLTRLETGNFSGNFSISADGQWLYFCKSEIYGTFSKFSDLYVLHLTTGNVRRLTRGMRAVDPAISPDGKTLVFSTTDAGSMTLMHMDVETEQANPILHAKDHTQFHHPAFSSDGRRLAVQVWKTGGFDDIYVMNPDGSDLQILTFDTFSDSSPVWGLNDQYVFFSSDRTGVPNIFAYSLETQKLYQITNVLTGVFNPDVSPDGSHLVFEKYSSQGMDIHMAELHPETWVETLYSREEQPQEIEHEMAIASIAGKEEREYSPYHSLLPKFWVPGWGFDEDGVQLGAMTGGRDVLQQHTYSLSALYGLDSQRISYSAYYINKQFRPTFTLYGYDTASLFVDIFEDAQGDDEDYWQRDRVVGLQIQYPIYRSLATQLSLTTGYRYHDMKDVSDEEVLFPEPDEGALSGVSAGITFSSTEDSLYAISPERGFLTSLTYQRDDEALGSDYNLNTFVGDARIYVEVPKLQHHVLALKAAGGISEGDTLSQGVFQLGGYSTGNYLAYLNQRRFFLRGYDANSLIGDRFAMGSVEYRFPIWFPQRGIGKGIVFFDSIVGAAFYDIGNAWDRDTSLSEFKDSVGAELRINTGFQYNALPLTFRLGFAEGLDDEKGESQFYFTVASNFWL